jgi:hypothetical protein
LLLFPFVYLLFIQFVTCATVVTVVQFRCLRCLLLVTFTYTPLFDAVRFVHLCSVVVDSSFTVAFQFVPF